MMNSGGRSRKLSLIPLGLLVALLASLLQGCHCEVSEDAKRLAREWSPLVWIHSQDPFYPSSVDFYMQYNEVIFFGTFLIDPF